MHKKKDWKIIDDSNPLSNAICFIVFSITGKWVTFFTSMNFVCSDNDYE